MLKSTLITLGTALAATSIPTQAISTPIADNARVQRLGTDAKALSRQYTAAARARLGALHNVATLPLHHFCEKENWTLRKTFGCIAAMIETGNRYNLHTPNLAERLQDLKIRSNALQKGEPAPKTRPPTNEI